MTRRLALVLAAFMVVPLVVGPVEVAAQESGAALQHDLENGCGAAGADFVPDTSAVIRSIFGDPTAVPELLKWLNDTDSVNYLTESCNTHDRCYGTYGIGVYLHAGKFRCDWAFFTDLAQACAQAYLTPDKPSIWDYVSAPITGGIPTVWTAKTLFDAAQYTPCVDQAATAMSLAVGLFGWWAFDDGQDDARAAATCTSDHPQPSYTGIYLPAHGIERGFEGGCRVVNVAYGDGRWAGTSRQFGNDQSVYWLNSVAEVQDKWNEHVTQGRPLTSLEYGNGTWVAAFTGDPGFGSRQRFSSRGSFSDMQGDIQSAWAEGLAITELEYGDGRWVMFASSDTGFSNQEWERGITSDAALAATIQAHLDDGWAVTNLEFEQDEWFAVFSEGVDWRGNGASPRATYHELRVTMDEHADAGRMVVDMEYGHGTWWGVWAVLPAPEIASPATTPPPATTPAPTPPAFIAVPDVMDQWSDDAAAILQAAGFGVNFRDRAVDNPSDSGRVVDQIPDPGQLRREGFTVTVVRGTYSEPEPVVIAAPDVLGQSSSSARNEIEEAGLVYAYGGLETVSDSSLDGVAVGQSPGPGAALQEGDTVTVRFGDYVAPLVAVPDLGGLTESDAVSLIQSRGLVARRAGTKVTTDSSFFGRVMDQEPFPYGADVPAGSTVDYWIGEQQAISYPSQKTSPWASLSLQGSGHGTVHSSGETLTFCVSWSQLGGEPPPQWDLISFMTNPAGTYVAGNSMLNGGVRCPAVSLAATGTGLKQFVVQIIEYSYSQDQWVIKDTADLWIYLTN